MAAPALSIFVLGASGDLAHKKTFPALLELFAADLLPADSVVVGYARSAMTDAAFREGLRRYLHGERVEAFLSMVFYRSGSGYDDEAALGHLSAEVAALEASRFSERPVCRIFYLALPPSAFLTCARSLHLAARPATPGSCVRVVVEKPFGRDLESSDRLTADLARFYSEDELYRIDHYLGKEMTLNLFTLRFANIWGEIWNRASAQGKEIGRGGGERMKEVLSPFRYDIMGARLVQIAHCASAPRLA